MGACSISRKIIDCTLFVILCNFLFIVLFYCTFPVILCNKIAIIFANLLNINTLSAFIIHHFCNLLIFKYLQIIFVFSQKKLLKCFVVSNIVLTFATSNKRNGNVTKNDKQVISGYSVKRFSVIPYIMLNDKPQTNLMQR